MVVISYRTIRDFYQWHKDAKDSLNNWYTIVEMGNFANFNELRDVFNSVDAVGMTDMFLTSGGINTG